MYSSRVVIMYVRVYGNTVQSEEYVHVKCKIIDLKIKNMAKIWWFYNVRLLLKGLQ